VPNELFSPIYAKMIAAQPVRKPLQFMSPSIEGKSTNFFEWSSAGYFNASNFRGTMHSSASTMISRLYYGFDRRNLFLRIDSQRDMRDFLADSGNLIIELLAPTRVNIELGADQGEPAITVTKIDGTEVSDYKIEGLRMVCDQICELKLPFASISASKDMPIELVFVATGRNGFVQHFPPGGQFIEIVPPDDDFETDLWFV